jgi:hypothetical protein
MGNALVKAYYERQKTALSNGIILACKKGKKGQKIFF